MADSTVITVPVDWTYLPDLMTAARLAANQHPLPQFTAQTIRYIADKDNNLDKIYMTTDFRVGEGNVLGPEERLEDASGSAGAGVSARKWYVKSDAGAAKLEILMEY